MSESVVMVFLRLIHIIAGVFWGGTAMVVAWFILPTQRSLGQPGMAFMRELMFVKRLRFFGITAMLLTVISGLTMYIYLGVTTHWAWAASTMGKVIGVGAVSALFAGGIGGGVVSAIGKKMMALGAAIQSGGGTPTDSQKAEMGALQARMTRMYRITAVLVLIAIAAMASARYLNP
jgi:hypothetical protein